MPKGVAFSPRASCWCLQHNEIPIHTIRCNAATASKRFCVCSRKKKNIGKNSTTTRQKASPSAIEFSEHFHCSCVGQKFFSGLVENFFTLSLEKSSILIFTKFSCE